MSCKSTQTAYNTTAQTVTGTLTTLNVLGSLALNSGTSIETTTSGFSIKNTGIYRVSYDITFTPTAVGAAVFQLYKDSVALPCAVSTTTTTASGIFTTHLETTICVPACCALKPLLSVAASGVAGTVNRICANVTRIA